MKTINPNDLQISDGRKLFKGVLHLFSVMLVITIITVGSMGAQTLLSFEDISLSQDSFINGSDGSDGILQEEVFFPHEYDFNFDLWTGQWAVSNSKNDSVGNATNLYGAVTGGGASGQNYLVSQRPFTGANLYFVSEEAIELSEVYITNTTYAHDVIRDGNQFSKAFGGISGNDPDEYFLRWKGFLDGQLTDSVDFHLADYRFSDNTQDYIVDEWTRCNLSDLGVVDSVSISFFSTDIGQFGINTPLFFAMDDLKYIASNSSSLIQMEEVHIYPNPAKNMIFWDETSAFKHLIISNMNGAVIMKKECQEQNSLNISHLPKGCYQMLFIKENVVYPSKLVKN